MSWTEGYVADVDYTYGYYRELTPAILSTALLLKGIRAPSTPLTYCELGCGQGYSANIIAAANPDIQVFATDFNPNQIANALALAQEGKVSNVHFFDASFKEFGQHPDVPKTFDIICLHGIYSWIGPEVRKQVVEFIRTHLRPGGIVYMSYNTQPGWSQSAPLRRLMIDAAEGATMDRVAAGIDLAARVKDLGAKFFAANPIAGTRFDQTKGLSQNYLAHEYFNRDWTTFYFSDLVKEVSDAKLTFASSAHFLDLLDGLNLTADQLAFLNSIGDGHRREALRDYFVNQVFRRDIFAKGIVKEHAADVKDGIMQLRLALTVQRADFPLKVTGSLGEASLDQETYDSFLDLLAKGPQTVQQMCQADQRIGSMPWHGLLQAITVMLGSGHLQPCVAAKDEGRRKSATRAFNAAVMKRAEINSNLRVLASPVTGGGVGVDRFHMLFLRAIQAKVADPASAVWKVLDSTGQKLAPEGKAIETAEENVAFLRNLYEEFTSKRLPLLQQLGIA
jgi:SAM-dependent methyltransferase